MARIAVFASGTGSNFVALAEALRKGKRHSIEFLVCNVASAPVLARAEELHVPTFLVDYRAGPRESIEKKIVRHLERRRVDLVALAGYMKLLTPYFIDSFKGPVINIHPSLLPKYPGIHSIKESFESGDKELGITIMRIDTGVDTGPVLLQKSFLREGAESLERIEARIHGLEHDWFPHVAIQMLDDIDRMAGGRPPGRGAP